MASLVFLDFDGVICDSAAECFSSSWDAYFGRSHAEIAPSVRADLLDGFLRLRPFVRSGEDFMICQEILHRSLDIRTQSEFDDLAASKGPAALARLRDRFYRARERLLRSDRAYWIGLNTLYPTMAEHLRRWAGQARFYVLSTKRPQFIAEILEAGQVDLDRRRILYAPKVEKGQRIEETLQAGDNETALLVDDQIDHLQAVHRLSNRVAVYLASWGYVKPEWLADPAVPVITLHDLPALVDAALG